VAYVPIQEMLEIESFDEGHRERAALARQGRLLTMEIAAKRASRSLAGPARPRRPHARADCQAGRRPASTPATSLADLAVDELTDITGQSEDEAKSLIMKAREHWFTSATAAHE
jgi:N utilization substance protein A